MSIELNDLKVKHERMVTHHSAYKTRKKITISLFYVSVVALIASLIFIPVSQTQAVFSCAGSFCNVIPWLIVGLFVVCSVLAGIVDKHQKRGVVAYQNTMRILLSMKK